MAWWNRIKKAAFVCSIKRLSFFSVFIRLWRTIIFTQISQDYIQHDEIIDFAMLLKLWIVTPSFAGQCSRCCTVATLLSVQTRLPLLQHERIFCILFFCSNGVCQVSPEVQSLLRCHPRIISLQRRSSIPRTRAPSKPVPMCSASQATLRNDEYAETAGWTLPALALKVCHLSHIWNDLIFTWLFFRASSLLFENYLSVMWHLL